MHHHMQARTAANMGPNGRGIVAIRTGVVGACLFTLALLPPLVSANPVNAAESGNPLRAATASSGGCQSEGTEGYWLVGSDGGVFSYGNAEYEGSMGGHSLDAPVVGMAAAGANGYWLAASDGGVFSFGCAAFDGSMGGQLLATPIVGVASPNSGGYWLVSRDGGVFAFGAAGFYGSLPADGVHADNIVGMAGTPDGKGYWLVGSDGGVFAFGDAVYGGSAVGMTASPMAGIAADQGPSGGYWLVARSGAVFAFGGTAYDGSANTSTPSAPIVGITPMPLSYGCEMPTPPAPANGYHEAGADGGVFSYGAATYLGSMGGRALNAPIVGMQYSMVPESPPCAPTGPPAA